MRALAVRKRPGFQTFPRGNGYHLPEGLVWAGTGVRFEVHPRGSPVGVSWDVLGIEPPPGAWGVVVAGAVRLRWRFVRALPGTPKGHGLASVIPSKTPALLALKPGEAIELVGDLAHGGEVFVVLVRSANGGRWPAAWDPQTVPEHEQSGAKGGPFGAPNFQ